MLLEHEHSQEDVFRSVAQPCEEQGCSTQVLLTPVPKAGAVSGQGRARHSLYVWLLLRLLLLKNLLASTLLRDTEQREGFCFLYSMLSITASLITCRNNTASRKLTFKQLWNGQKQPLLLLTAAAPTFSSAPSLNKRMSFITNNISWVYKTLILMWYVKIWGRPPTSKKPHKNIQYLNSPSEPRKGKSKHRENPYFKDVRSNYYTEKD